MMWHCFSHGAQLLTVCYIDEHHMFDSASVYAV
jgi:hypothetical protein